MYGNAYQWFRPYLENGTQIGSIKWALCNRCPGNYGVSQGKISGPLKLVCLQYINDLPNCLPNCEPRMYADDSHLTYADSRVDNIQFFLNQELENVHNWLRANKLTLNMTKTEIPLQLLLIMYKLSKLLRVTIDNKLVWSNEIDKLTKKVAPGIRAIKRMSHFVPQATLHLICQALNQPRFD